MMIKNMKVLAIGGNFDDDGGRSSGYMSFLFGRLAGYYTDMRIINGGYYNELSLIIDDGEFRDYDAIFWFANVPNGKPKLLAEIKTKHPKCILISSKNNSDDKYSFMHLMARALKVKSNLLLEIKKSDFRVHARILDPLGNCFCDFNDNAGDVADNLFMRVRKLHDFTRVGSIPLGDAIEVPDEKEFFALIKGYAEIFHKLMHTESQDRLLGNASFRCMRGMPSFRGEDHIFVSRRNIDKRFIGTEGFVAVEPSVDGPIFGPGVVRYYGQHKPSVDTPIQLALYNYYPGVNYMVHSHTYVLVKNGHWGSPIKTSHPIPCGAIQEFNEIAKLFPERDCTNFCINLKGHGCLIMAKDLDYFNQIKFEARVFPELMT